MEPLISVVTPTFNILKNARQNYFEQLCDSVVNQSYKNIEHIIIDGNSDDGTIELIKKYMKNCRGKYLSEPDAGIYDAFNKGVNLASGKYIIFMGTDDYFYDSEVVSKVVLKLEEAEADFSYGDVYLLNETRREKSRVAKGNLYEMFFRMSFCHQSVFMRKSVLEESPFNTDYKISADYDLCLKLLMNRANIIKVNEIIAVFRTGGASSNQDLFDSERIAVFKNRLSLNDTEALNLLKYKILPGRKVKAYANFFTGNDRFQYYCTIMCCFIHYLRSNIIRIRTSKGKESFVLFGKEFVKRKV